MPSPNFSKDITAIFNNSKLKFSLKLDMVCRLVCEDLKAFHTSMLMYSAKRDALKCRGSYISPHQNIQFLNKDDIVYKDMIANMPIYEYFDSKLFDRKIEQLTIEDLKSSIIYGNSFQEFVVDKTTFENTKFNWENGNAKVSYKELKRKMHEEIFQIDASTISGNYFKKLLEKGNRLTNEIEIVALNDGPQKGKLFFEILKNLGIQISEPDLYYIGLPLFATERYTGILRIVFSRQHDTTLNQIVTKDRGQCVGLIDRLNNFAQLISLHLKTDYYLDGYRAFTNLQIGVNEDNLKIEIKDLREACNTIVKVINCNGCIIRFSYTNNLSNPPIQATSETLEPYFNYLNSINPQDSEFSQDIYNILLRERHEGGVIKAISFSIDNVNSNTFDTEEYYYDQENILKTKEVKSRVFKDFTSEYNKKLLELKMCSIVVVCIDEADGGIIVITNTANRRFTISDIEMILLATNKIQLEIKLLKQLEKINADELHKAQLGGMNIIFHQVGQIVKTTSDTLYELHDRIDFFVKSNYKSDKVIPIEFQNVLKCIKLLGFLSIQSSNQILRSRRINELETQSIKPEIKRIHDFNSFIKNKCKDFEPYANAERDIHIWFINNDRDWISIDTDAELLTEVLYNLLDNAVKYSFDSAELRTKKIAFDKFDFKSDGNIQIRTQSTLTDVQIEFINWGPVIPSGEKKVIFERAKRGSNTKSAPGGSGLGLFICKKIIDCLGGSISVDSANNKTSFKIILKK